MSGKATLLAIGDVHLGTTCSGVPDDLPNRAEMTPAFALGRAIDHAIDQGVCAVLFAGDVVESTNARFEAMRPLEAGVKRLVDAGIQVIAVAGNHDVEALPRLAALMPEFRLLGAGGRWEIIQVTRDQAPVAEIVGWSFPQRVVRSSPVAQLLKQPPDTTPTVPRIGLLHADLDAAGGNYAPVRSDELAETGYDAWLLGHIHKPSLRDRVESGERPYGYLGSLVGLDASETGPRGPWLITISEAGSLSLQQTPLAPLRWENVDLAVDGIGHVEDVADRLAEELETSARRLGNEMETHARRSSKKAYPRVRGLTKEPETSAREPIKETDAAALRPPKATDTPAPGPGGGFSALGLRFRLVGTSPAYREIRQWVADAKWRDMQNRMRAVDGKEVFLNKVTEAMTAHHDLEQLAERDDPVGLMARRLLDIRDDKAGRLLEDARMKLRETAANAYWSPLKEHRDATDPLADGALRDILWRSGMAALGAMLEGQSERRRTEKRRPDERSSAGPRPEERRAEERPPEEPRPEERPPHGTRPEERPPEGPRPEERRSGKRRPEGDLP